MNASTTIKRGRAGRKSEFDAEVGSRLRELRVSHGLSQGDLGKRIGVSFQQVQKYEKGVNAIASSRMRALCNVFNVTPNDLFDHDGNSKQVRHLSAGAIRVAMKFDELPQEQRRAVTLLLDSFGAD